MLFYILLFFCAFFFSFQPLFCKRFTESYLGPNELSSPVFSLYQGIVISVTCLLFSGLRLTGTSPAIVYTGLSLSVSPLTLLFGVLSGAATFGHNLALVRSSQLGPYSIMSVLLQFGGILPPLLISTALLHENLSLIQYLAIALTLFSIVLMNRAAGVKQSAKPEFYLWCLFLFSCNGLGGIFHLLQSRFVAAQLPIMLSISYLTTALLALAQLLIAGKGAGGLRALRLNRRSGVNLAIGVFAAALANNLSARVLPFLPGGIYYTVQNGGVLLLACIYAATLFRERLSPSKAVGMLLAIIGLVTLSVA